MLLLPPPQVWSTTQAKKDLGSRLGLRLVDGLVQIPIYTFSMQIQPKICLTILKFNISNLNLLGFIGPENISLSETLNFCKE